MPIFQLNIPDNIHIHIHQDNADLQEIKQTLSLIIKNQVTIMSTQEELAQQLSDFSFKFDGLITQVTKIGTETTGLEAAIAALKDQLATQPDVKPELQTAFDNLVTKFTGLTTAVQAVDDLVADAPAPEPAPEG